MFVQIRWLTLKMHLQMCSYQHDRTFIPPMQTIINHQQTSTRHTTPLPANNFPNKTTLVVSFRAICFLIWKITSEIVPSVSLNQLSFSCYIRLHLSVYSFDRYLIRQAFNCTLRHWVLFTMRITEIEYVSLIILITHCQYVIGTVDHVWYKLTYVITYDKS